MTKIVWEGTRKEFGTSHRSLPVPKNAIKIREGDGFIKRAILFGILPMLICMAAVVMKAYFNKESPVSPVYLIPAIAIGFIIALPLHEFCARCLLSQRGYCVGRVMYSQNGGICCFVLSSY